MIYLVEIDAVNTHTGDPTVLRAGTHGYTTLPTDDPPNAFFTGRIKDPGNYSRSIFENGTSIGAGSSTYGYIEFITADGVLDDWLDYAVDGRNIRVWGLPSKESNWSERMLVMNVQAEFMELKWLTGTISLRNKADDLKEVIQTQFFAGTTVAGGMNEAEGMPDDLQDKPKPLLFGRALNFAPPVGNSFDRIYVVSARGPINVTAVRDRGVNLAFHQDYATLTALRTASIPAGRYGTCAAQGIFRLGGNPAGEITCDAQDLSGVNLSAARVARRILEYAGFVADVDFLVSDVEVLHNKNPAQCGLWLGTDRYSIQDVVGPIIETVGGYIVTDRLSRFRLGRLEAPEAGGYEITRYSLLDRADGLERLPTNDQGGGIPAKTVTLEYRRNYTVMRKNDLDQVNATEEFKGFASVAYRSIVSKDDTVAARYLTAPEMDFQSLFLQEADAKAEADRRLAFYGTRRDRYRIPIRTELVWQLDLGDEITLKVDRFGLNEGRPLLIVKIEGELRDGTTTLEVFG